MFFFCFCFFLLLLLFYFYGKPFIAHSVDPDQMPHYVASDLGLHCLPMAFLQVSREECVSGNVALSREANRKS